MTFNKYFLVKTIVSSTFILILVSALYIYWSQPYVYIGEDYIEYIEKVHEEDKNNRENLEQEIRSIFYEMKHGEVAIDGEPINRVEGFVNESYRNPHFYLSSIGSIASSIFEDLQDIVQELPDWLGSLCGIFQETNMDTVPTDSVKTGGDRIGNDSDPGAQEIWNRYFFSEDEIRRKINHALDYTYTRAVFARGSKSPNVESLPSPDLSENISGVLIPKIEIVQEELLLVSPARDRLGSALAYRVYNASRRSFEAALKRTIRKAFRNNTRLSKLFSIVLSRLSFTIDVGILVYLVWEQTGSKDAPINEVRKALSAAEERAVAKALEEVDRFFERVHTYERSLAESYIRLQ